MTPGTYPLVIFIGDFVLREHAKLDAGPQVATRAARAEERDGQLQIRQLPRADYNGATSLLTHGTGSSVELLIYERALARVRDRLDSRVVPLIMDDEGVVRRDGEVVDPSELAPHIAWANRDLYTAGPVRAFMIACLKSPRLAWLQSSAAGFEHPVFAKLIGNGVRLTNSNASAVPIAEFVFAQVLAAFHPSAERLAAQANRRWESLEFRDVHASTWLVFGLGHVGAAIAERARAFGAHVIGCRRQPRGDEPVDEMVEPEALLEALTRADVVVLAAALNASNRHTVNASFVEALRPDAVLVNIGRGGLVDEQALLEGLDRGRPGLAVLDVFENEPLAEDSPFWNHPRVRLTAHCAGASEGTSVRGDALFLNNLARFLDGRPLELEVEHVETVG